jgi:hypothetical protein
VLYEGPNFGGRTFQIDSNYVANLGNTGFNDRTSSVRIERGYWIFCSDANFQGQCRTLGPGDYAQLPAGLDNRISSARRISDEYPYSSAPTGATVEGELTGDLRKIPPPDRVNWWLPGAILRRPGSLQQPRHIARDEIDLQVDAPAGNKRPERRHRQGVRNQVDVEPRTVHGRSPSG